MTIGEVFERVWREHWDKPRFHKSGHAKEVRRNYENHIGPTFGSQRFNKITPSKVRDWHQRMEGHPIAGNRSLEVLAYLYRFEGSQGRHDGVNPCSFITPHRERKRRRFASTDEIRKIGSLLRESYRGHARKTTFLYALIFTGARPRFLERAQWADLSKMENGFGVLKAEGKSSYETGEDEVVLFPPTVMELIYRLPRTGKLIFNTRMPRALWDKIRKEAGCEDLWARDLRRTFATVGMSGGIKMDTISELLNHKSVQTTKIYAKLNDTARIESVSQIEEQMNLLLGKKVV